MTNILQATFRKGPAIYSAAEIIKSDIVEEQRDAIALLSETSLPKRLAFANRNIVLAPNETRTVVGPSVRPVGFEERIFNSLVSLKVAVSQYAMYLSDEERHRLFDQLDAVINIDDWHEGDELPNPTTFQEFLKWMIYSKYFKWISIGVSHEGNILVAWRTPRVLLTANFLGSGDVRWTAQIKSETGEAGHTVGHCPLRLFAEQALFYLSGASGHEGR